LKAAANGRLLLVSVIKVYQSSNPALDKLAGLLFDT